LKGGKKIKKNKKNKRKISIWVIFPFFRQKDALNDLWVPKMVIMKKLM